MGHELKPMTHCCPMDTRQATGVMENALKRSNACLATASLLQFHFHMASLAWERR